MRYFFILVLLVLGGCVSQPLPDGFKDSDDFNQVEAAKTRISLGLTYLKNGNYSQAKFNLDKALQFAPRLADAHYSLAYYYQVVGEDDMAEEAYQEALDYDPRNPDIANTYGAFLCQKGKYEKAKEYFLKAVNSANYVSTAETYENLALCSQSQGQVEDAIDYLQQAINHQPSRSRSLLMITQLLTEQSRWEEAKIALRRYEKTARVSADTLWLAYKIEKALGNQAIATGYGDMLVRMFPSHANTKQYVLQRYRKEPREPEVDIKPKQLVVAEKVTQPVVTEQQTVSEQVTDGENKVAEVQAQSVTEPTAKVEDVPAETQVALSTTEVPEQPKQTPELALQQTEQTEDPVVADNQETQAPQAESVSDSTAFDQQSQPAELSEEVVTHHVVKAGENLYRISLLYNVKMNRLIEWNQLQDASSIYIGMKLVVVDPETIE